MELYKNEITLSLSELYRRLWYQSLFFGFSFFSLLPSAFVNSLYFGFVHGPLWGKVGLPGVCVCRISSLYLLDFLSKPELGFSALW